MDAHQQHSPQLAGGPALECLDGMTMALNEFKADSGVTAVFETFPCVKQYYTLHKKDLALFL